MIKEETNRKMSVRYGCLFFCFNDINSFIYTICFVKQADIRANKGTKKSFCILIDKGKPLKHADAVFFSLFLS